MSYAIIKDLSQELYREKNGSFLLNFLLKGSQLEVLSTLLTGKNHTSLTFLIYLTSSNQLALKTLGIWCLVLKILKLQESNQTVCSSWYDKDAKRSKIFLIRVDPFSEGALRVNSYF